MPHGGDSIMMLFRLIRSARPLLLAVLLCACCYDADASARAADERPPGRFEFTRLIAHWAEYADDDYLKFVEDARPEVCQVGFYGGHFYSLAHTPQYSGYPAHLPVQGIAECGAWFEQRNAAIHRLGAKVVGHFNVTFLVGEPAGPNGKDGPRGFFKFYRDLWDERELGPRPVADPTALLARNADGTPMSSNSYSIGGMREFTACLVNPYWRAVLKAWAGRGIERGVDGFIANYFYRHNCLCEHCQAGFRAYLAARFTPEQLGGQFGIVANLNDYPFTEIVGWHDPKDSTPLRREMLRWSQIACKSAFDEVFVQHARSLKPGLLVAQWNHLGDFDQIKGDERCLLPGELWGRDEDYSWYSTGGTGNFTDLAVGYLGDATLQARYVRGAFDDKPFTLGKYETTRIRAAIAELAANGGAPMGFYTSFKDPEARAEIVRYYRFIERYEAIFRGNRSHAEVLLLYPRTKVHAGNVSAVDAFRTLGQDLLRRHVLFDVLPDDLATPARRGSYRTVLAPDGPPPAGVSVELPASLSRFDAPAAVRVSASRPGAAPTPTAGSAGSAGSSGSVRAAGEITLHFVNYNREEPTDKRAPGQGIRDEKPRPVAGVTADLALPPGAKVTSVRVASPELPDAVEVTHTSDEGRVRFTMPRFLVYAVARVELSPQ